MYRYFVKPVLDFIVAFIVIIIFSPVFLMIMMILGISNAGSPFFVQFRPGKNNKIFKIIKFKTMNDKKDAEGNLLIDEKRLTPIGKLVRKTSLDEIPQLFNVINGDMSLVGPRPLLPEYLKFYSAEQATRHEVKPGITGWAQVNGRNTISWQQKFKYDIYYVNHQSFFLDLRILFLTFIKVFNREGVYQENETTMEHFKGNN